jgi:hypothetical protein
MCHGQLNNTDFKSLALGSGVYSCGGEAPDCALAERDTPKASAIPVAIDNLIIPLPKVMIVPPVIRE